MVTGIGSFPNRPFRLRVETWYNWQSGTAAAVHVQVWIDKLSYSPTYSGSGSSWELHIDSRGKVAAWAGGYDFRNGDNFLIAEGDWDVTVNSNGDVGVHAYANFDVLGYTEAHVAIDGYPPAPPNAPTMIGVRSGSITTTSFQVDYSRNPGSGPGIDYDQVQWATDAAFTNVVVNDTPPNGYPNGASNPSGMSPPVALTPGVTHYVRARSHNAIGWSGWSATISGATLPTTPPGISGTPSLNGQSISLLMTPPSGFSGVTKYNIEYRLGSTGPVTATSSTTSTKTITGLTPGSSYQYRADAEIGSYTTPWSNWVAISQPNPNTNPGNYFDGSTTDTAVLEYAWEGAVDNSRSQALAFDIGGWSAVFAVSGSGTMYQVAGGAVGDYAARVVALHDMAGAGQWHAGQKMDAASWSEVEEGSTYSFSIYVNPSQPQRMQVRALFQTALGADIAGSYVGPETIVAANVWTRISGVIVAPAGAERAAVRATDVAGTGFSVMTGGDSVMLDGAMISLGPDLLPYFDGWTQDTTLYDFYWLGTANASVSGRRTSTAMTVDPLNDPDCSPLVAPPRPPVITADCIEEIGSWRRYTLQITAANVPRWGSTIPTLVLSTGGAAERQVRIRFYSNPDGLAPELVDTTEWASEQIVTYIPPDADITLDGVTKRAWADVADQVGLPANQLIYGTGGIPAEWPELDCGYGYVVTLDTPLESPTGNLSTRILLTQKA